MAPGCSAVPAAGRCAITMPGSAFRDSCVCTSGTNPSSRSDRTAASRVSPTATGAGGSTTGEVAATGEGTAGLAATACG